ncbi:MAG: Indole-3-glycerol phosphate synthase [Micrococcaceae bacterium]|uniref:Indole-3-glycerol phosphate synthase n=1 Tax=Arthrobacter cheniae TaxID=1258888 RepID=A0A3A5MD01_9MICC|nr:indole-3-glycerol phosphate synthase TrpC [Arthrobacter cheniae]MCU1634719.1 Indole-3-glycerol phosphate synthase [Micrococcaceae bacterium]RJT79097.1 indole-3-glycerol phosphate synthase TrpC [Arthrobacter cheniae]
MTVLDDIIEGVREDLAERRRALPLEKVRTAASSAPTPKDAFAALGGGRGGDLAVIAEVKRSSPSKGALADIADPAALAAAYERGGAAVISVLTEERRFGGSLSDLDAVRAAVALPVLRKDFTVDEYQIWEARAHGADVVLLIVAALSDADLTSFLALTHELGMKAIVETHTEEEVRRAVAAEASIIGVNVRNLKTLDIDRDVFAGLAHLIPAGTVIIAESGVRDAADVADYAGSGAHAVLVGEALVRHSDPAATIDEFRRAGRTAWQESGMSARS